MGAVVCGVGGERFKEMDDGPRDWQLQFFFCSALELRGRTAFSIA